MSESKYRIPRVTVAVMVLGGASCDDDKGGTGGVNVSKSRIDRLAEQYCETVFECPETREDYEDEFGTEQQCVEQFGAELNSDLKEVSKECGDAYLDYYECYLSMGCSAEEGDCEEFYERAKDECPDFEDEHFDNAEDEELPQLRSIRPAKRH